MKESESALWSLTSPYPLYLTQKEYASSVTKVCKNGGVLLVEAGTGFGKTIANLLGAIEESRGRGRQLVYLSKTHRQNHQIMSELEALNRVNEKKNTGVQLASRKQLCHLPEVADAYTAASDLCKTCRDRAKRREARYSNCVSSLKLKIDLSTDLPLVADLRDLRALKARFGGCAYLSARDLSKKRDLVTGHYFYLLSEDVRDVVGFELDEATLILDEGHNLESVCCEIFRRTIDSNVISRALSETQLLKQDHLEGMFNVIRELFTKLRRGRKEESVEGIPAERFIEIISDFGIDVQWTNRFFEQFRMLRDEILERIKEQRQGEDVMITNLDRLAAFFETLYDSPADFGIVFTRGTRDFLRISLECLNPAKLFSRLAEKIPSIIVCSGTLSPLKLTAEILGVPEATLKSFGSIADPENVAIVSVADGVSGNILTTKFQAREEKMFQEYRNTLENLVEAIPQGGILVFFPSYRLLEDIRLPRRIGRIPVFEESRISRENEQVIHDFKDTIERKGKAVLSGVFGGRFAEGADFPGQQSRAIVICGIPYPPAMDPVVQLRRNFLENKREKLGNEWYSAQAFRKVAQALGRGWRGKRDFAIGFLLDERFQWRSSISQLPQWLRMRVTDLSSWPEVLRFTERFFEGMEKKKIEIKKERSLNSG